MTPANERRVQRLEHISHELFEVLDEWTNEMDAGYADTMPYLPSFDEFAVNFQEWSLIVRERLAGVAQRTERRASTP